MYRNCIFCSADLGANESIEQFPVGRSLAFDAVKGRLWAVCPKCARWNLAPIEERWEAIEASERLFRDTRMRAQSENIGLAKLRDGTRLIRVGEALAGELAAWRYGETLVRRHRRAMVLGTGGAVAAIGIVAGGAVLTSASFFMLWAGKSLLTEIWSAVDGKRMVYQAHQPDGGAPVRLRRRDLKQAHLSLGDGGLELHVPNPASAAWTSPTWARNPGVADLVISGDDARTALGRAMVVVNGSGGRQEDVRLALAAMQTAGSPEALLMQAGRQRTLLNGGRPVVKVDEGKLRFAAFRKMTVPTPTVSLRWRWRWRCTRRRSAARWRARSPHWRRCGARPSRSPPSPTGCRTTFRLASRRESDC
jgi:hypothetical protein